MQIVRFFFTFLWRIWFYILMALPILVMFPLLLLFTARTSWYPYYFVLARVWAGIILFGMGFFPKIKREQQLQNGQSYMIVANHTSMTDIMLMLYSIKKPFVFVGKKELTKIPLFGFFYKRTCILVDRSDKKSRTEVFEHAQNTLNRGISICIFPEGGVSEDSNSILDNFKDGAFRLAITHQIPVLPLTFYDNKKRFPFTFFSGSPGKMRVKVHKCISTLKKTQTDKRALREQTKAVIMKELMRKND
ncbi:MAG TPA: lysophospholipid acyltransferase family protein [Salinimicrobium sp.]|nr:lysophospholipid acyltransferase family protein [Salinimicrobium sp.]